MEWGGERNVEKDRDRAAAVIHRRTAKSSKRIAIYVADANDVGDWRVDSEQK